MKIKPILLFFVLMFLIVLNGILFFNIFKVDPNSLRNILISKLFGQPYCKDCNVILISLDTLSANHLPCYGYERNTAPNLCKFGKENIMFKNMYSNSSWTLPSHVSIFTGLYPGNHKVNIPNKASLSPKIPFLPEIIQNFGYKTYFFMEGGSSLPEDKVYNRGIDKNIVVSSNPKDWDKGLKQLAENQEKKIKTFIFFHTYWTHAPYFLENKERKFYTTENKESPRFPISNNELLDCSDWFLKYFEESLKHDLDVHYWDEKKHEKYMDIYKKIQKLKKASPSSVKSICRDKYDMEYIVIYMTLSFQHRINTNDKEQVADLINSYDSKIRELDEYMQNIVNFVMNSSLKNNTIIIFTSDHGEEFGEHGKLGHGNNLYDTSLKVPFIMYVPGQNKREIMSLTQSVDITPTLLRLIGITQRFRFDGSDIFGSSLDSRYILAELIYDEIRPYIGVIRNNFWKLHYKVIDKKKKPLELYQKQINPMEKNNVIFKNEDIVNILLKKIPD